MCEDRCFFFDLAANLGGARFSRLNRKFNCVSIGLISWLLQKPLSSPFQQEFFVDIGFVTEVNQYPIFPADADDAVVGRHIHNDFLKLLLKHHNADYCVL